jgi:16S rRNA G966 N2-methylase RsmD
MYNMHKFFARKQEDVIREYISTYSSQGEVILDPFCGSGVMIGEALRLDRKAIGIDINPVAIFITRNTVKYVDPEEIKAEFDIIRKDIAQEINSLYLTRCRKCNHILPAICYTWSDGRLVDVRYECNHDTGSSEKKIDTVDDEDLRLFRDIEKGINSYFFDEFGNCKFWYPTNRLYYEDGMPFMKKERFESVDELFTKRNLIALAKLLDRIEKIEKQDVREALRFAFSSLTHLASRMTPVRPSRPFSSAWVQQSYWAVPNFMESNVWDLFERAVQDRQSVIKAKKDQPENFKMLKEASQVEQIEKGTRHHYLLAQSSIDALNELSENSVDYVITDPPYSSSIQYAELLFMWGCWLKLMDNFNEIVSGEVIVNPKQGKNDDTYENMLFTVFRKVFYVLKEGRYCTVTFHNPDLKYRNILFKSLVMAGFEFEKIVYQPPPRASAKSLLQPFGSLEGDYFFRFRKPKVRKWIYATTDEKSVETLVVDITKKIIAERGEPTPYTFIQNSIDPLLYEELRKYGLLMDFQPESIKKTLEKYIGDTFVLVDVDIGKGGQKALLDKAWWFADPNKHRLDIPLNKRVEEAIVNLLHRERRVTFTQVLTEIYTRFQNSLTPEDHTIKCILAENARPVRGGKMWEELPFVERIREKHEEMVYYIAQIGVKCGFHTDVAVDEYDKTFDGKRLATQLQLLSPTLDGLSSDITNRIKRIDVIWHDGKEIKAEFEVEHSTSLVDAVVRGSNIKDSAVLRIMVVPEEREDLVYRRFNEPAMEVMTKNMEWKIMTYKTVRNFYNKIRGKNKIEINDFMSLSRKPRSLRTREAKARSTLGDWA